MSKFTTSGKDSRLNYYFLHSPLNQCHSQPSLLNYATIMSNSLNCSQYSGTRLDLPTIGIPQCAIINAGNNSAIVSNCCGGPTAIFTSDRPNPPPSCFIYCNITNPGLTYQTVSTCILSQMVNVSAGVVSCTDGKPTNTTSKSSAASVHSMGVLGWMTIGFFITGIVVGS